MQTSVDIHCHILPGVDDGSRSFEQSVNMAKTAESQGISHIIATPHYIHKEIDYSIQQIEQKVYQLNKYIKERKINVSVYQGAEVHITPFLPEILKKHKLTLNGSRYVLVEFPLNHIPDFAQDTIYNLLATDYIPIIAHPERNRDVVDDPNTLYSIIEMGALAQVTSASIAGRFGRRVEKASRILFENKMAHLVATDAHSDHTRPPRMRQCVDILSRLYGEQKAYEMAYVLPYMVLQDKLIQPETPTKHIQKRKIFPFFR